MNLSTAARLRYTTPEMKYAELLDHYPIISDQIGQGGLSVVLRELERVLMAGTKEAAGDVAEFGCYSGTTSLFIRRLLNDYNRGSQSAERQFYAYDSFAGLPPKTAPDASNAGTAFQSGELSVSKRDFLHNFQRAGLRPPIVHKAWFKDLTAEQLPSQLAFAFLDGDFYESILDSLKLTWPRLSSGGTITIDDYQREALPGVTRAVHDFFGQTPADLRYEHNIAIIKKS